MTKILIVQSFCDFEVTPWIARCLSSVEDWCQRQGYGYQFMGDALFAKLPTDYLEKVGDKRPVAADLARLLWIAEALQDGQADVVVWLDADVFVFAPEYLDVRMVESCVFGREFWLQAHPLKSGFQVRKNVHNAYCGFSRSCPVLPFLIDVIQRMVRRVDAQYLAPQFVGPKLLTSLHNIVGFDLDPRFGAVSPLMATALIEDNHALLSRVKAALPMPLKAANLCHSLHANDEALLHQLMDRLATFKSGWK